MEFIEIQIEHIMPRSGPNRYNIYHAGLLIQEASVNPEVDAARHFVKAGADMDSRLVVYDYVTGKPRSSARLGFLAEI